jgi:predicted AlkP superfamily pyrophosphatase or phosphodiesterase
MRKLAAALIATSLAGAHCGQAPAKAPPQLPAGSPKLLVVISVDQFSADLFDEYRPHFSGGLARLASGAAFHNGYQSHAATETCPGHSTILTGAHPARTGIIGNIWVDQNVGRSDTTVYCAEDERVPESSSTKYTVSPLHLMVPTLGELMKRAYPGSRSVAVSGKDRAAVMMTGHVVDQRWYWTGQKFDTDLKEAPVPKSVVKVNSAVSAALAQPRPALEPTPFCQAKERQIAVEGGSKPVGTGRFARTAGDAAALRASPELDGDTLALAALLVDEMQLGRKAQPDLLAISLSATDYVGHAYGTEGEEMCLQLLELDREIGDFLSVLDARGIDYSVVLTADHGGLDIPERLRLAGVKDATRIGADLSGGRMGLALTKKLGLPGFGLLGEGSWGDIYIDHKLPPADQKRLLGEAVAAYRAHPLVEAVFTAKEIAATPMPTGAPDKWTLIQRARASYYPGRSGDFVVFLKKEVTPIFDTSRYIATHGSPWDYDRRVPILFWRKGMPAAPSNAPVDTVDILPTLAAEIGLPVAQGSIDGHCLGGVPGVACPGSAANPSATQRGH